MLTFGDRKPSVVFRRPSSHTDTLKYSAVAIFTLAVFGGTAIAQESGGQPCNELCQEWMQTRPMDDAPAVAQDDPSATQVTVSRRRATMVNDYYSLNPDCSSRGEITVSLNQPPLHGEVSIDQSRMRPRFEPGNPMRVCNSRRVDVTRVFYEPQQPGFGSDTFELSVVFPNGEVSAERFVVNARP